MIRWKGSLANTIPQGGTDGSRKRGRPAKSWISNTKDLTGLSFNQLIRTAEDREVCKPACQDASFCRPTALKLRDIDRFLSNVLVKAEITVKDIKRYLLHICDALLQSYLTGKQLTVLFHCCFYTNNNYISFIWILLQFNCFHPQDINERVI